MTLLETISTNMSLCLFLSFFFWFVCSMLKHIYTHTHTHTHTRVFTSERDLLAASTAKTITIKFLVYFRFVFLF